MEKKRKLLVFHQALAPYRVDLWNSLNELFDLELYFMYENLLDQKFNQDRLRGMLNFKPKYLQTGITIGVRAFRFGFDAIIKRFEPEFVFSYEYSQTTVSLFFLSKKYRFKLYSMCDDSLPIAIGCSGLRKVVRNFLVKKLDGLVLISQEVADWYEKHVQGNLIYCVLPILANESIFRKNLSAVIATSNEFITKYSLNDKKCVFFVGRLSPEKGIDRLIISFASTSLVEKDAVLILIGTGEQLPSLRSLATEHGVEDKVFFLGRFEGSELMAWYNLSQVFVLASHHEPFGAVINEALLSGSSVICSTSAGAATLIQNNLNGRLFDPYDIGQLTQIMLEELRKVIPTQRLTKIRPSQMNVTLDYYLNEMYFKLTS